MALFRRCLHQELQKSPVFPLPLLHAVDVESISGFQPPHLQQAPPYEGQGKAVGSGTSSLDPSNARRSVWVRSTPCVRKALRGSRATTL
jgi:hypothetical protein